MKTPTLLSPTLRTFISNLVSRLPAHMEMAVGVENEVEVPEPYYMELRVTSGGTLRQRQRITFSSEEQVMAALANIQASLGLPSLAAPAAPAAKRGGFADLDKELAAMSLTASTAM